MDLVWLDADVIRNERVGQSGTNCVEQIWIDSELASRYLAGVSHFRVNASFKGMDIAKG